MIRTPWDPGTTDWKVSPHTGLTRASWLEAGNWLLEGAFAHTSGGEDIFRFPKLSPLLYPGNGNKSRWATDAIANFESLARTFLIAGHLLRENQSLSISGIGVADYYRRWLAECVDPGSPHSIDWPSEIWEDESGGQPIVELAAVCLGLWYSGEAVWGRFSTEERETLTRMLHRFAHARTYAHNWRFFSVIMLSFLKSKGIPIDETALDAHLDNLLCWYAGDGWYRDGNRFDYYSGWAFQLYASLWIHFFGDEHRPDYAKAFLDGIEENIKTYPHLFSRQGHSLLWGRSAIYRCAASSPLPACFLPRHAEPDLDPGFARRICSGNLLQFLKHSETLQQGILTPGFYGTCDAVLQNYSCPGSPYWMGKAFSCLLLDADHPFWTERETEGFWTSIDRFKQTRIPAPGLTLLNRMDGSSELISAKVRNNEPYSNSGYMRLSYHSHFPWQPINEAGVESMGLTVKPRGAGEWQSVLRKKCAGSHKGVLYAQLGFETIEPLVDLAVLPFEHGLVVVFRIRVAVSLEWQLGSHAIDSQNGSRMEEKRIPFEGMEAAIIQADGRLTGAVPLFGWNGSMTCRSEGIHPAGRFSALVALQGKVERRGPMPLCAAVLLHSVNQANSLDPEVLFPVRQVKEAAENRLKSPGAIDLLLRTGDTVPIRFNPIEGTFSD